VGHLHLPLLQHGFDISNHLPEVHALSEVIARLEMSTNLFHRHVGDDGAVGDTGLQPRKLILNLADVQRMIPRAGLNRDPADTEVCKILTVGPPRSGFDDTNSHQAERTDSIP